MPIIKPISGHTSTRGVFRYLTKDGRALACDYLNLDAPEMDGPGPLPGYEPFDWSAVMDKTRHDARNDLPWRGKRVRTYKHYVVSPDPQDQLGLDDLRELTMAWVREHFSDFEVAVVYHDDNEGGIPHAHVVANNTNLSNWRRLQDPDPRALKRSIQHLAQIRGMHYLKDLPKTEQKLQAPSLQNEYMRRAEVQLRADGKYSWVADIRSRVKVARSVAHSEDEFRSLLGELGVQVSNNSAKAARADWIYSFSDAPTRRVSGEKLGLAYGRESLLRRFEGSLKGTLPKAYEERLADIARQAVVVGDLVQLQRLSDAVTLIKRGQIKSSIALDVFMRRPYERMAWNDLTQEEAASASEFIRQEKMLPFRTPGKPSRTPITSEEAYAATRPTLRSEAYEESSQTRQHDSSRGAPERSHASYERER